MEYSNTESDLLEDYNDIYLSDVYLWLRMEYNCKNITYSRSMLNNIAIKYNLIPENYKNKILLIRAILDVFETKFNSYPEYKKKYEELHGWSGN
jgi:hypothetical protein